MWPLLRRLAPRRREAPTSPPGRWFEPTTGARKQGEPPVAERLSRTWSGRLGSNQLAAPDLADSVRSARVAAFSRRGHVAPPTALGAAAARSTYLPTRSLARTQSP